MLAMNSPTTLSTNFGHPIGTLGSVGCPSWFTLLCHHFHAGGFATDLIKNGRVTQEEVPRLLQLAKNKQWHSGRSEIKDFDPVGEGWTKVNKP